MLKSVIEYQNYHQFILDYYTEKKCSTAFTWREFAKVAGFASGSYLKLVSDGKAKLVEESAKKTATAMGLQDFEYDYFMLLVQYENAKDSQQKIRNFHRRIRSNCSAANLTPITIHGSTLLSVSLPPTCPEQSRSKLPKRFAFPYPPPK